LRTLQAYLKWNLAPASPLQALAANIADAAGVFEVELGSGLSFVGAGSEHCGRCQRI